jgi:hypothetical protein
MKFSGEAMPLKVTSMQTQTSEVDEKLALIEVGACSFKFGNYAN